MTSSARVRGTVRLRGVGEGDLEIFFEHQRDPDANRMAAFPARDRDAFASHWARILGDETVTIVRADGGRPGGAVDGVEELLFELPGR